MEAVECGAASLAMVLAYHGKYVSLEELRIACGVSRDGSKASNVLKAALNYGLIAKGYKLEPDSLKSMKMPVIVHWNFNHFLVLEGFKKGFAYLNDPNSGRRKVTEEEFDLSFTGVVLSFEPSESFTKGGEKPGALKGLGKRLEGSGNALIYIFLAGLAISFTGLVIPAFSRVFIDDILLKGNSDWLSLLLFGMALTACMRGVLIWL
ncbi:MAG: NHLP family bacteriocin export ABC transporter peptidase/permease/ATPase, partial [Clostridiaceae bacterium]|nr:NHLP family bacteriocin export ABC transporter peptidase/permease/ATPase [Clostridiaceae bacterium]